MTSWSTVRPGRARAWTVGIAHPHRAGVLLDTLTLTAGAVATSGTAERGEHIWDPVHRRPARGLAAATVAARDIVRADVLATAAVARGVGAARLARRPGAGSRPCWSATTAGSRRPPAGAG